MGAQAVVPDGPHPKGKKKYDGPPCTNIWCDNPDSHSEDICFAYNKGNKEGQYPDWVGEPRKAMFEKKRALNKRRDLALQKNASSNQCPSANVSGTEEERTGQSAASEWFKQATRSERNAWVADMKKYQKTEQ